MWHGRVSILWYICRYNSIVSTHVWLRRTPKGCSCSRFTSTVPRRAKSRKAEDTTKGRVKSQIGHGPTVTQTPYNRSLSIEFTSWNSSCLLLSQVHVDGYTSYALSFSLISVESRRVWSEAVSLSSWDCCKPIYHFGWGITRIRWIVAFERSTLLECEADICTSQTQ